MKHLLTGFIFCLGIVSAFGAITVDLWTPAPVSTGTGYSVYASADYDADGEQESVSADLTILKNSVYLASTSGSAWSSGYLGLYGSTVDNDAGTVEFYAYGNGYSLYPAFDDASGTVQIVSSNVAPAVSLTINGVTSAGGSANSLTVSNGTTLSFSTSASDPNGNFQCTRIWTNCNDTGWSQIRNEPASADSFQYTVTQIGTWQFHCRSLDSEGMESATAVINVTSANRAPTVTISASPTTISYGQSTQLTATGADPDSNLYALGIMRYDGAYHRPDNISYARLGWNGYATEGGWSSANFTDDTASGASTTKTISYQPVGAGTYSFHANGHDGTLWTAAGGAWVDVQVLKTTPTGTYHNPPSFNEGTALGGEHLNAVFANPYQGSLGVPGAITYTILSGGSGAFPNGTVLQTGQFLPEGSYAVRATLTASANYNTATRDATITVGPHPLGDADHDGMPNNWEQQYAFNLNDPSDAAGDTDGDGMTNLQEYRFGTHPRVAQTDATNSTQLKVHKP